MLGIYIYFFILLWGGGGGVHFGKDFCSVTPGESSGG